MKFGELQLFFRHLKLFHNSEGLYECIKDKCLRKFISIATLKKHVMLCDKPFSQVPVTINVNACKSNSISSITVTSKENVIIDNIYLENSILLFISKLYSNSAITNAVVQDIVEEFTQFVENVVATFSDSVKGVIPVEYHSTITNLVSVNILNNLNSHYKRKEFLKKAHVLVEPRQFITGKIADDKRENIIVVSTTRNCYGYILPIRETLKYFLELPNVFEEITNFIAEELQTNETKIYTSVFQGKRWNDISPNFEGKLVIPIIGIRAGK